MSKMGMMNCDGPLLFSRSVGNFSRKGNKNHIILTKETYKAHEDSVRFSMKPCADSLLMSPREEEAMTVRGRKRDR